MKLIWSLLGVVAVLKLCLAPVPVGAQSPNLDLHQERGYAACTLRIHVDGLRNSKGKIGTVIFTSPDGWPEDTGKAFRAGPAPIAAGERQGTAVWNDLPPGDYGVAAIHDENSNAKLDKNLFGIPKEGFGFANNPPVGWGPAPFKAALVHVICPVTEITIHIQYK